MVTIWNVQTGEPIKLDLVDAREYVKHHGDTFTDVDPNPPAHVTVPLAPMSAEDAEAFRVAANVFVQKRDPADPENTAWRQPVHMGLGDGLASVSENGTRRIHGGRTGATWPKGVA